jgi:hypothetical protein
MCPKFRVSSFKVQVSGFNFEGGPPFIKPGHSLTLKSTATYHPLQFLKQNKFNQLRILDRLTTVESGPSLVGKRKKGRLNPED